MSPENRSEAERPEPDWPSRRLRWVLLCAFVALLGLILNSGLTAIRALKEMRTEEQAIREAFADRSQRLAELNLSIEVYNETVQRYVIYPPGESDPGTRDQLDRITAEITSTLNRYPADRQPEEAEFLRAMHDLFARNRDFYGSILALDPDARRHRAPYLMSEEILPMQTQILQWSQKLRLWDGRQRQETDQAILTQFGRLEGDLTRSVLIALIGGMLLVFASMWYILRLERQTRSRYHELARSRHELECLSSRLVDAQETERRSISRELHDEVGQSLGVLLVDLGRLSTNLPGDRAEIMERLGRMKSVAERTVQTVRDIALLLRPSMLDDLGLVAAVEWQGREVSRRSQMEVSVDSEGVSEDLPDDYKICVYRLAQEALNNSVRHSGARHAEVRVEQQGRRITVRVHDDGRGFDPQRARGLGILGMEERVRRLGGTLAIDSAPGRGATLRAELPLPGNNA